MAVTLEAIRAAGGIVHSDGNIFFRDISMLQGLAGAAPAAVAPALDVTLDEDQAGLLRDMLGDHAEYPEAITIRLMVGDGHSGHGLYVAQAEYQDEGAVLLASLPAPAAPQAPAEVVGWLHPQWAAEQGRGRIYGHNPGGYIAVQIAAPQAPAAPAEPIAWMATPVMQSGRGTSAVFCSDKLLAERWNYGGHPEYGRMIVTGLYAAPVAAPAAPSIAVVADEQIDAILDSPGGLGMVIADKRERMRMFARRVLDLAAPAAPAVDADGARYRYLRDEHIGDDPESINLPPARKSGLDAAVDAAIAAQAAAKGEHGNG